LDEDVEHDTMLVHPADSVSARAKLDDER
jgi:hypothetical protein